MRFGKCIGEIAIILDYAARAVENILHKASSETLGAAVRQLAGNYAIQTLRRTIFSQTHSMMKENCTSSAVETTSNTPPWAPAICEAM